MTQRGTHMAYVELRDVGKDFVTSDGTRSAALAGFNLEIERGEFITLFGLAGCGKSTVLGLLSGLLPSSRGSVRVDGAEVAAPDPRRMLVVRDDALLPWLNLRQNIALAVAQAQRQASRSARRELVAQQLALARLSAAAERRPGQVSPEIRQRCSIARAFATEPQLVLLDEPFAGLDLYTRASLQDALLSLWSARRTTVVMITGDIDEALLLSDRVVMLSHDPAARPAEIMRVELPRPRDRAQVLDAPTYYRQRDELRYFLDRGRRDRAGSLPATARRAPERPARARPREQAPARARSVEQQELVLGYVPLLDCAPLVVAQAEGLFAAHNLRVTLSREPSWTAISDGIREGRLDAAQMIAGMPLAESLGSRARPAFPISTAITLSRGGNAITLSNRLHDRGVRDRASLRLIIAERRFLALPPLVFGMVHAASMHNLLLRAWLSEGGIDPDRDVDLVVIPPPQMLSNLDQGNLCGYCVGEPWNRRAVREGIGFVCATDSEIWPDHPEKVLGVGSAWARKHPKTHLALVSALLAACELCDQPDFRAQRLPQLLRKLVGGKPADFAAVLSGPYERGDGHADSTRNFVVFHGQNANLCRINEIYWIFAQLARLSVCNLSLPAEQVIHDVYMEPLLREAAAALGKDLGPQHLAPLHIAGVTPSDPSALQPRSAPAYPPPTLTKALRSAKSAIA